MSNIVYEDKMYNAEVKREYISSHKKGTQKNLERIFKITQVFESDMDKELFTFTREELRKLFFTFMASTPSASKSTVQYVSGYIDWAIDEEYYNGINPLETVDVRWKEQFVVKPEKNYWTDSEIKEMVNGIVSAQVAIVFYAPFIGIKGTENSEIVNLKKSDIDDETMTARLVDLDKSVRTVQVDHEFIRLCHQAMKEEEFIKSNGNPEKGIKSETAHLISNEFIVRSVDIGVKNTQEADGMVVYRRYSTVAEYFNEPKLNPTSIMYSGMLAKAKQLLMNGNLDKVGYKEIALQFNFNETTLRRYKDDFLNERTIRELYEIS
ncbi:integrase [Paenibacillus sp. 1011MAR3C5]|uniref:phage lytic cycle repressor MrpR family protein n=1 Tax=Paenibacillus sp. 1011MAR3C5 TaxID=1675787 RepID=UPI0011C3C091|nr:integrase [Paenibacillus sp. 1011MAR3C5]